IASFAILISVLCGSVREAVLLTYIAEILWLAAPTLCEGFATFGPNAVAEWAGMVGGAISVANPITALWALDTLPPTIVADFAKTMVIQLGISALLVALAAMLLRPAAQGSGPFGWKLAPVAFLLSRRRLLPRPGCRMRPVLWKEMHVAKSRVLT